MDRQDRLILIASSMSQQTWDSMVVPPEMRKHVSFLASEDPKEYQMFDPGSSEDDRQKSVYQYDLETGSIRKLGQAGTEKSEALKSEPRPPEKRQKRTYRCLNCRGDQRWHCELPSPEDPDQRCARCKLQNVRCKFESKPMGRARRKCDACYSKGRNCVRPSRESPDQKCERCKFNNIECNLQPERAFSTESEDEGSSFASRQTVVQMPGDNSCLFHAIGSIANGQGEYDVQELRSTVAQILRSDPQPYAANLVGEGKTVEKYCEWIQKDDSWGGEIEIQILSRFFGLELYVVDYRNNNFYRYNRGMGAFGILLYDGAHYNITSHTDEDSTEDDFLYSCSTDPTTVNVARLWIQQELNRNQGQQRT